ncbi:MAG: threonylcarbamoyl-AMP synthase [candidate division Zixibacteria bacterium]|nr:threonylcarbamoyl-AMP synthase [candidate division Zixibacteria bacterium]
MSRVIVCNPAAPEEKVIAAVVEALTEGLAVVIPTETQYGLAVRADSDEAPGTINRIKGRAESDRSALFVRDIAMAEAFCVLTPISRCLATKFLPGPLTLVLPAKENQTAVSRHFLSPHGIGIRLSSSPLVAAVMARVPFPVTATSANRSGEMTPATVDLIHKSLGEAVGLYLDGGPCRAITPSTVAAVNGAVRILRHGAIAEAELRSHLRREGLDG